MIELRSVPEEIFHVQDFHYDQFESEVVWISETDKSEINILSVSEVWLNQSMHAESSYSIEASFSIMLLFEAFLQL